MRILVVDDEPLVVSLIERAAAQRGYTTIAAVDPREALAILEDPTQPIDVLLTDVMMPGLNGRQLAERATVIRKGLPVVYMSGYSDVNDGESIDCWDASAMLHKPFSLPSLMNALEWATRFESLTQ